jgi:hypothetical protein
MCAYETLARMNTHVSVSNIPLKMRSLMVRLNKWFALVAEILLTDVVQCRI